MKKLGWAVLVSSVLFASCAPQTKLPANVAVGMSGFRQLHVCSQPPYPCKNPPVPASADDPPRIVAMWFLNGLDLQRGDAVFAHVVTSANTASLELRTNLFSLIGTRTATGRFEVRAPIYDLPAIFIRSYTLRVIARNARGDQTEEDLPLRIR